LSKVQYNEKHKKILDSFLLDIPIVKPGKMYGHPAYYVNGKLFASLFMDGVCVKIPKPRITKLLEKEGIKPFEPMGRKMKEWIFIVRDNSEDYINDRYIFEESIEYVSTITGLKIKKEKESKS
jgi:hypothetical protein